jgi:hypothetical protein
MTHEIIHGLCLSTKNVNGRMIAVISDGTPQRDDYPVTILTVEKFAPNDDAAAREWFERMKIEQPWNERN